MSSARKGASVKASVISEMLVLKFKGCRSVAGGGVGVGVYRDIDEAMGRATGVARSHQPNEDHADVYAMRYEVYRELVDAMAPAWQALASDPSGGTA